MLKAIISAYKKHALYRATYRELYRLTDKELLDIGIDRCEIDTIARETAYGKETGSLLDLVKESMSVRTEKKRIEEYLADSANLVDLENRIKEVDLGNAPWQKRAKMFSQGWAV
jgi:uncharacterized protein YjiS (DUF1127 family)